MVDLQQQVLDHFWSRVELLALEAESGEHVTTELAGVVSDALESFAETGYPSSHRDGFVRKLVETAEAFREASPSYATMFSRAALLTMTTLPA
jgi:hypothetical protein